MKKVKALSKLLGENIIFLIIILLIGFFIPRLIPGSPLTTVSESTYVLNENMPEEELNRFKEYYSPDKSMLEQLKIYIGQMSKADLGYSFYYGLPVRDLIPGRLGWTLFLSIGSIFISSFIGIPLGIAAAIKKGRIFDFVITMFAVFVEAVPVFIIGLLLQLIFAYKLGFASAQGAYSLGAGWGSEGFLLDATKHSILPITAIVISLLPSFILLTRNVVAKIKEEDYVKMAIYNNVDDYTLIKHYILRNSMPEIISKINIHFVYAVAGTLFVEMIFSYPGMGELLKIAVSARDYCLVQGIFLVTGIYGISVNLIFGFIANTVNPRLRR